MVVIEQLPISKDISVMIITEEKNVLKKKLLQACIKKQQSLIDDFKGRIDALLSIEGLGNEEKYDNNELSQSSQKTDEVNSLNEALEFANEEMKVLQNLATSQSKTEHTRVEPGAVVVTNHESFFISVSAEKIEVDGQAYIGISCHSPLFLAMKEKRKGYKFTSNERPYQIEDIF
jgi:hypothetical protein